MATASAPDSVVPFGDDGGPVFMVVLEVGRYVRRCHVHKRIFTYVDGMMRTYVLRAFKFETTLSP